MGRESMWALTAEEIRSFTQSKVWKWQKEEIQKRMNSIMYSLLTETDVIKINRLQAEYTANKSIISMVERKVIKE